MQALLVMRLSSHDAAAEEDGEPIEEHYYHIPLHYKSPYLSTLLQLQFLGVDEHGHHEFLAEAPLNFSFPETILVNRNLETRWRLDLLEISERPRPCRAPAGQVYALMRDAHAILWRGPKDMKAARKRSVPLYEVLEDMSPPMPPPPEPAAETQDGGGANSDDDDDVLVFYEHEQEEAMADPEELDDDQQEEEVLREELGEEQVVALESHEEVPLDEAPGSPSSSSSSSLVNKWFSFQYIF